MYTFKRLLLRPIASGTTAAEWASLVLTFSGILAFSIGLILMPQMNLTEREFYLSLLTLVSFMFGSFGVGQLAVIADRLNRDRNLSSDRTKR